MIPYSLVIMIMSLPCEGRPMVVDRINCIIVVMTSHRAVYVRLSDQNDVNLVAGHVSWAEKHSSAQCSYIAWITWKPSFPKSGPLWKGHPTEYGRLSTITCTKRD